eukprot:gene34917-58771_t
MRASAAAVLTAAPMCAALMGTSGGVGGMGVPGLPGGGGLGGPTVPTAPTGECSSTEPASAPERSTCMQVKD